MSTGVPQSVLYMKVTDALHAPGPGRLEELSKTYNIADFPNLLQLAVEFSGQDTVKWVAELYQGRGRNLNEVNVKTGNTALHTAVTMDRRDIVRYLMSLPPLDDTIRNKEGLTAVDCASTPEMEQVVQAAENRYAEKAAIRLRAAFKARDIRELELIYSNPRVSELLNINGLDPDTGRTVLHEAARIGDLKLVQFILAHGGDPLVRDKPQRKLPQDYTSNEEIKSALTNAAKSKAILDQTATGGANPSEKAPPSMDGYLKKWTNFRQGYKLRWFVLRNGTLTYYKRSEDVGKGERLIRGSLGLRHAFVRLDSSEKNKFQIGTPSTQFFLKANHVAETNKWVWALQNAITYVRDEDKRAAHHDKSKRSGHARNSSSTSHNASSAQDTARNASPSGAAGAAAADATTSPRAEHPGSNSHATREGKPTPPPVNTAASIVGLGFSSPGSATESNSKASPAVASVSSQPDSTATGSVTHRRASSALSMDGGLFVNDLGKYEDDSDQDDEEFEAQVLERPRVTEESMIGRLSAIKDLLTMLVFQVQDEAMRDAITTAQGSIDVLSSDTVLAQRQVRAEKRRIQRQLENSDKGQREWAKNYRDLEVQYEKLEGQLFALKKEVGGDESDDEFFDTVDESPHGHQSSAPHHHNSGHSKSSVIGGAIGAAAGFVGSHAHLGSHSKSTQDSEAHTGSHEHDAKQDSLHAQHPRFADAAQRGNASSEQPAPVTGQGQEPKSGIRAHSEGDSASVNSAHKVSASGSPSPGSNTSVPAGAAGAAGAAGVATSTVSHPESSDAKPKPSDSPNPNTEAGSINEKASTSHDLLTPAQEKAQDTIVVEKSFSGYEDPPRRRLKINADNRPRLSLWGILKNLIGKDMTKMTLPVTFNECTSLLQRSAEDMEYVDLLDKAAEAVDDAGLRMAYVAAFAGSSYSSTIGRVAKPFNPLLGETYEYSRPDKGYRLFAEQVSHHPPIGALMAESKHWDFYGESNVESHFYGRSFDINPLGLWYLNLRPNKGADTESELYSFRKLTSSVVGIMMGNPVVDNYGDMTITNHTSGIKAVVTYKPRGWRGNSAYKLQGRITDKNGKELWTIAGQWNDKMWAKKTGSDTKILLWEVHPRHETPFHLTDFAITLNALPDNLKPWLPPTDTRLRPDQRAMEEGRYDDASDEKSRVEDKQRQKRREREESGIQYKPQWFELTRHPITGKDYYKPINNYWKHRAEHDLADAGDIF